MITSKQASKLFIATAGVISSFGFSLGKESDWLFRKREKWVDGGRFVCVKGFQD